MLASAAFVAFTLGCDAPLRIEPPELPAAEPLSLSPSELPLELPVDALFYADVAYGEDPRQRLDLILPAGLDADQRVPLVIYAHGGGFTHGGKHTAYSGSVPADIRAYLSAGVAFCAVNYRLLASVDSEGVRKPMGDVARALQFLRRHAAQLQLDPERVGMQGVSAGAGTALWLGVHDDLADPWSNDPIARESTRLSAVAISSTQATYDLLAWDTDVFVPWSVDILVLARLVGAERTLRSFYGVEDLAQLEDDELVEYRHDVDMLSWMSPDDAPIWVGNYTQPGSYPFTWDALLHHAMHAAAVRDAALAHGVEIVAYAPALNIAPETPESRSQFLLRHLLPERPRDAAR